MTYAASKAGIKTRRYTLYARAATTYVEPTTDGELTTLIGTMEEIGEVENQNKKWTFEPSNTIVLDDGNLFATEYKGSIEIKHINNTLDNITALNTTYNNVDCDVLLYDALNEEAIVVKDFTLHLKEEYNSGAVSSIMITGEKLVPTKASLVSQFGGLPTS